MEDNYNYTPILTQATTKISAGYAKLIRIIINTPLANGVIKIYNNTTGTGTGQQLIGTITMPATPTLIGPIAIDYGISCPNGLTVVTSGANQDITVVSK